jgi:hypothetical protein
VEAVALTTRMLSAVAERAGAVQAHLLCRGASGRAVQIAVDAVGREYRCWDCVVPRLTLLGSGVAVELSRFGDTGVWAGTQLVQGDGVCPSVPSEDGKVDMGAVVRLSRQSEDTPGPEAMIGAESSRTWGEVAPLVAAAVRIGKTRLRLFLASEQFAQEVAQCREPIVCPGVRCPTSQPRGRTPPGGQPPAVMPRR